MVSHNGTVKKMLARRRRKGTCIPALGIVPHEVDSACGRDNYMPVIMVTLSTIAICCNVTETREQYAK